MTPEIMFLKAILDGFRLYRDGIRDDLVKLCEDNDVMKKVIINYFSEERENETIND